MPIITQVEDTDLKRSFKVTFSFEELDTEMRQLVTKKQETMKLSGFRPGKIPPDFIRKKFSAALLQECSQGFMEKTVEQIISEHALEPIGRPEVDIDTLEDGKDFVFGATFYVHPTIPSIDYSLIKLQRKRVEVADSDVSDKIDELRKKEVSWKEEDKNYRSKMGDMVNIDFVGKIDGTPFPSGSAKKYDLILGGKTFIDNFEDQLVDKCAGDNVDVKVTFPSNYGKKSLAGRDAVFETKIHSISSPVKPEVDDDFARRVGARDVDDLREKIHKDIYDDRYRSVRDELREPIFEWLKENVHFGISEYITKEECERRCSAIDKEARANPNKFKSEAEKNKAKEDIRKDAENSARIGLILSAINRDNDITVTNAEKIAEIRRRAAIYYPGREDYFVSYYVKSRELMDQIAGALLEEKAIDFIIQHATVTEI